MSSEHSDYLSFSLDSTVINGGVSYWIDKIEYQKRMMLFQQQFPYCYTKHRINPYTNTTVETRADYVLYCHLHVIRECSNSLIKARTDELSATRTRVLTKKLEQSESYAKQLEAELQKAHRLSDDLTFSKKFLFRSLLVSILCCVCLAFFSHAKPSRAEYNNLLKQNAELSESLDQANSDLKDASEQITDLKHDISASYDEGYSQGHLSGYASGLSKSASSKSSSSSHSGYTYSDYDTTPAIESEYIGNSSSHKFHRPDCSTLPSSENQVYFDTRDDAINQGYVPCKRCNP